MLEIHFENALKVLEFDDGKGVENLRNVTERSLSASLLRPPGNGDRQHPERQEGIPEGQRGRQGQVGVPELRRRVDTERDGAAAGGERGERRRVLHSREFVKIVSFNMYYVYKKF